MDELLPIGRFSALSSLSPKALRIYHENGLLEPAFVDAESGYRYYSPSQLSIASRISLLRRAGIGLGEIAAFLSDPDPQRVERWREDLDREVDERRRLLAHMLTSTSPKEQPHMTDATVTPAKLNRAIPVLASLDLEATQRFYAERLGFASIATYPDYAISERDGVQVHFWLTDDRRLAENTSCRVDVTGIDVLYDEMLEAGVVHPNGKLADQPWGLREFAILDNDGNLIKFAEPASA